MRKALETIGLTLLIAILSLLAVSFAFHRTTPQADADPNDLLVRTLMPYLRDGGTFRLSEAYPDSWEAVQVVRSNETLTDWEWRTLRAYDVGLIQLGLQEQALIFWQDGAISNAIRFDSADDGMPWFVPSGPEDSMIFSRDAAVFRATLVQGKTSVYYACEPMVDTSGETQI